MKCKIDEYKVLITHKYLEFRKLRKIQKKIDLHYTKYFLIYYFLYLLFHVEKNNIDCTYSCNSMLKLKYNINIYKQHFLFTTCFELFCLF